MQILYGPPSTFALGGVFREVERQFVVGRSFARAMMGKF
jgi:hypothetical protein